MTMFISIPETTLPSGLNVPAFQVARYPSTAGAINASGASCKRIGDRQARQADITADGHPWVNINYHDARKAAAAAGYQLLTESQALAIAWLIYQQDDNWTGGKVGEGSLFQGLRNDTVDCPQPGTFDPADPDERTWHTLPGGERIYHFAGNCYSWIFDDLHGDADGIVSKPFSEDDASLQAPFKSLEKGLGWRPSAGTNWSGDALVRGGSWGSERSAGAFRLVCVWPSHEWDLVGFRCTNPGL